MRPLNERANTAARRRRVVCIVHLALCMAVSGCAARRLPLPSDPGPPLPDYAAIHARVASACRGVRTLEAVLALRGRAGAQRLSGRVRAGFERPDSMRLEGVAPFGPPAFLLASRRGAAVLLLPREDRVMTGEPAEAILGALTGISLAPDDLQAILTGCVVPAPQATGGRLHDGGWATIDLEGGSTLYLQRAGDWQLRAATRQGWHVDYAAWQGLFPQTVRLRSGSGRVQVDMTATLSQIEANLGIDPAAFTIPVPESAQPLTIDELRGAGPLGVPE